MLLAIVGTIAMYFGIRWHLRQFPISPLAAWPRAVLIMLCMVGGVGGSFAIGYGMQPLPLRNYLAGQRQMTLDDLNATGQQRRPMTREDFCEMVHNNYEGCPR